MNGRRISLVIFVAVPCQLYAPQVHGDELRPNLPAEVRRRNRRNRRCLEMFSGNHGWKIWKIPEVHICSLNFVYIYIYYPYIHIYIYIYIFIYIYVCVCVCACSTCFYIRSRDFGPLNPLNHPAPSSLGPSSPWR